MVQYPAVAPTRYPPPTSTVMSGSIDDILVILPQGALQMPSSGLSDKYLISLLTLNNIPQKVPSQDNIIVMQQPTPVEMQEKVPDVQEVGRSTTRTSKKEIQDLRHCK